MGVNLRPFIKETRTAEIQELGSLRFTIRERSAYRAMVTVEVRSVVGPLSRNFKLNPPRSFYGYMTVFEGASVSGVVQLEFPRQRVLDIVNPSIRDIEYEIDSERANLQILVEFVQSGFEYVWDLASAAAKWVLDGSATDRVNEYVNTPVAPTLPTVLKFVASQKAQLSVTVDTWHYDTAASQLTDPPIDPDDPTDGEDEYEEPSQNPENDPFAGNPNATALDPGSDSRDNGFSGDTVNFTLSLDAYASGACSSGTTLEVQFQWVGAGPPPYTIETTGARVNTNCDPNGFLDQKITASNGASVTRTGSAGVFAARIASFTTFDA